MDYSRGACYWIHDNPKDWARMKSLVYRLHRQGVFITRGGIYTHAMIEGWKIEDCDRVFRRNHNFWSSFSRYMVMLDPKLFPSIEFRTCDADSWPLEDNWREIVNAGTTFLASSRFEAQMLYEMGDISAVPA